MLFHERILNFPPCLVPSDDYLNGSKHINFLFPHTFQTVWCNLFLVVSSWTHPTPYPSSRYWKSNKKKVKMGPKFDPTAITIGKIILTKKSLVIYTPPPSETYQQAWSGKFCWLRNVSVLNTIESRVFKPHKTINESPLNLICFRIEDLIQIDDMSPTILGKNYPRPFSSPEFCTEIFIEKYIPFWTLVKSLVDCLGIFLFILVYSWLVFMISISNYYKGSSMPCVTTSQQGNCYTLWYSYIAKFCCLSL